MLEQSRIKLGSRANLHVCRTDKFKSGFLSVNLLLPTEKKTASHAALLPRVLLRGTEAHPDLAAISEVSDSLYGAKISSVRRRFGETASLGLAAQFLERGIPGQDGGEIFAGAAALLAEVLLRPRTENGGFFDAYVKSESKNQLDAVRAEINNKTGYALRAAIRKMCEGEPFGENTLGDEEILAAITPCGLLDFHAALLSRAPIEIFYIGAQEAQTVAELVSRELSALLRGGAASPLPETVFRQPETVRRFTEKMDVTQGKLTLGWRFGQSTVKNEDAAAFAVFNAVFGGSLTSKLFVNVRERLSLCYYAQSIADSKKGILCAASGVEFAKLREAEDEILRQLEAIKDGDVTEEELSAAIRSEKTDFLTGLDSAQGLEDTLYSLYMNGYSGTAPEYAERFSRVTRQRVTEIARDTILDTVFTLEG
ncbi:MAG: insulinase family protein [Oscillospiraceae bacterium]|jgi:predicted Zn-dependent peptidase|nr:insulinase family protein [Oscillospiraceae bacterium]